MDVQYIFDSTFYGINQSKAMFPPEGLSPTKNSQREILSWNGY